MARASLPQFIAEVVDDRRAVRALVASTLALLAAGLNPQIYSPYLVDVQSAIRANPELLALSTLASVLGAGTLLIGGVAADVYRTRRILGWALTALIATSAIGLVVSEGPLFSASRIGGVMAAGMVVPFAIAVVATVYAGTARATAIGIAYAGFGLGSALPPILLTITGPGGSDWPAYVASLLAAIGALRVSGAVPNLPGASGAHAIAIGRLALWAFGVISLAAGLAAVGSGTNPVRLALVATGTVVLATALILEWRARAAGSPLEVNLRPVTVVLAAGLFIGFAQAAPMTLLPVFFQVILDFGPFFAVAALAPLIAALVVAGPVAGWLLPRISPRWLIGGGLIAVGSGDLLVAFVAGRGVSYLLFVMPFVLVGAGFVIATTVRTAVIFASVPRDLPASAAALNEASVGLGSRVGVVVAAVLLTEASLAAYAASVPTGVDPTALETLRDLVVALGTPALVTQLDGVDPSLLSGYADAYVDGIRIVHLAIGLLAVVAGFLAVLGLGRRDPLQGMWEHQD
jgi:MFS family permease